jgi:hypothetical protein
MVDDQKEYSFVKEMLIVFLCGGALGLTVLVVAELVVAWLKK